MMRFSNLFLLIVLCVTIQFTSAQSKDSVTIHKAAAPLYRDPVYDGAADPVVIYNKAKKEWWMFYTQRRANVQSANVAFCYGTDIGVATSDDHGQTWVYKGAPALSLKKAEIPFGRRILFLIKASTTCLWCI